MEGLCYISIIIGIIAVFGIVGLCLIFACMRSSQISQERGEGEQRETFDDLLGRMPDTNPDGSVNPYGGYPVD